MSGGAGYVLSREALDRFVLRAMRDSRRCRRDIEGVEDVEMGQCLASVGVTAGDSRDEHGRERFHPFTPDIHLIRGRVPRDNWFWEYNYYPASEVCICYSPAHQLMAHFYGCRLKAYIVLTFWAKKNQSFHNKSGKAQPIRTKFGIHGHVKG